MLITGTGAQRICGLCPRERDQRPCRREYGTTTIAKQRERERAWTRWVARMSSRAMPGKSTARRDPWLRCGGGRDGG